MLVQRLRHRPELSGDDRDRLRSQDAVPKRYAAGLANRLREVARPDVLDEQERGGTARFQGTRDRLDLLIGEPEGVAVGVGVYRRSLAVVVEPEAEQRADNRPQIVALVVERDELLGLRVLEHEQ
jgi:hypothetical protein